MQNDFPGLDRFDRAILAVLAEDGRISIADLARRIGLSKSPTQARLRRLEAEGVITGYRALIDPIRLGLDHVAFVEVRLEDTTGANPDALGARIIASDPSGSVLRQIEAGSTGVMSGGPPVAHMGLGSADVADVTVRWPDGETTLYTDVPTRRAITITR